MLKVIAVLAEQVSKYTIYIYTSIHNAFSNAFYAIASLESSLDIYAFLIYYKLN